MLHKTTMNVLCKRVKYFSHLKFRYKAIEQNIKRLSQHRSPVKTSSKILIVSFLKQSHGIFIIFQDKKSTKMFLKRAISDL